MFGLLANVAWTSLGPVAVDDLEQARLAARAAGTHLSVTSVDKFPRMTDYVVPKGVRIGDADRVRLGAHLAEGTTVMHEGFCQLQRRHARAPPWSRAASARASSSATAPTSAAAPRSWARSPAAASRPSPSDERCLLGAEAGIGISLGDDCVVEAGLYVTAGTRVSLPDGKIVKALELSGADNLLFRRNSVTGTVEALPAHRLLGRPERGAAQPQLSPGRSDPGGPAHARRP